MIRNKWFVLMRREHESRAIGGIGIGWARMIDHIGFFVLEVVLIRFLEFAREANLIAKAFIAYISIGFGNAAEIKKGDGKEIYPPNLIA